VADALGHYALLEDEDAVVNAIADDFHAVAESVVGPLEPLRAAYVGEPESYAGKYPAWVFFRVTTSGNSGLDIAQEKMLAEEYICQILVLDLAYPPDTSPEMSGRGHADASTRKGFSAWMSALAAAHEVHGRCSQIVRASTSSGSHSEFGRVMFVNENTNTLWAHSADIRVVL